MAKRYFAQISGSQAANPNPNNYPLWHLNSAHAELARTICVKGLNDIIDRAPLVKQLNETFGQGVVEHCEVVQNLEGLVAYVRLKTPDAHDGPEVTAWQCAYDAVEIFDGLSLPCPTRSGNVHNATLTVRPAVVNGLLWVSELPDRISDSKLADLVALLGPKPVEAVVATDSAYGRKKGWGVVKYPSDTHASQVLLRAREVILATTALPWPLVIQALAPLESTSPTFLLTLTRPEKRDTPPHFVQSNTMEWDFCFRWCQLYVFHRAQREALKQQQWAQRHELMAGMRLFKERDRWEAGKKDAASNANRLRRTLYVMGIKQTENKASVKAVFERYGTVEKCVLMKPESGKARGTIRYLEYADARRAKTEIMNSPNVAIGELEVRPMVESASLWVGELDHSVQNQQLKEAFEQFGTVRKATVAVSAASRHSLGYGVVEYLKHSVASDVLATMENEIFVMAGSSRPMRVEPYACSNKRWSPKSPADDLLRESNPRIVKPSEPIFRQFLKAREMQFDHLAEEQTLRMFQRQERLATEEQQQNMLNDEVAKLRDLEEMERASRHSNAIPPQVGNGPAHANSRHPESSAKKWWAGDVVVALTDTVITDLRDTYHIILDPAYHKQVMSFQVSVVAPSDTDATMTVWSAEESMLQTKGLVPVVTVDEHVNITRHHPAHEHQGLVAWRITSPTTSGTRAAFERFRHFLLQYKLAAVLRDDPGCRVYLVHSCEQLAPTPPDGILAISIHS